jgi:hypothetical protein
MKVIASEALNAEVKRELLIEDPATERCVAILKESNDSDNAKRTECCGKGCK